METSHSELIQKNATNKDRIITPVMSLVLLLVGVLLAGFSMGRWLAPLAAWIGPVCIMRYTRDYKGWRGYPITAIACILMVVIGFIQIWVGAGWPLPMVISLPIINGILWSLPYFTDRLLSARIGGFASTLVYPLAAATLELLINHVNPVGAWGVTGFTQYGNLPIMQLASVTGMVGITFLMGWFASIANWAWENRNRRSQVLRGLAVFGVIFIAVLIYGFLRMNLSASAETVRVAGIIAEPNDSFIERLQAAGTDKIATRQVVDSHNDAYFDKTVREAQAGARVILWDEMAGLEVASKETALIARAQEVARQNGIYLVAPLGIFPDDSESGQPFQNKLVVIDPTGAVVIEHIKYGGKITEGNRVQGNGILQTVATPFGVLSSVICWDLDYPAVVQQAGLNGTGLMLVPSRDWFEIDPVHSQMVVFRAIENGMTVVRQTDKGLSIAADPYGRVLAQVSFFSATDRTMVAQVPAQHVATIYTAFGRWFEWLCLVGFLGLVARALITHQRAKAN